MQGMLPLKAMEPGTFNGIRYILTDIDDTLTLAGRLPASAYGAIDRRRLAAIREEVLARVPGCAVAADQAYREADLAIDFCEDVPPLSREDVQDIARCFTRAGAIAKIRSIHVNGWYGDYDKLAMTRRFFADIFAVDIDKNRHQVLYVGDSPNDAPMFGFFPHSVGVANVLHFAGQLAHRPAWGIRSLRPMTAVVISGLVVVSSGQRYWFQP